MFVYMLFFFVRFWLKESFLSQSPYCIWTFFIPLDCPVSVFCCFPFPSNCGTLWILMAMFPIFMLCFYKGISRALCLLEGRKLDNWFLDDVMSVDIWRKTETLPEKTCPVMHVHVQMHEVSRMAHCLEKCSLWFWRAGCPHQPGLCFKIRHF